MDREELTTEGFECCDEIERLMSAGQIDQALLPLAHLGKLIDEIAALDPDPKTQQAYDSVLQMFWASVYNGNVPNATRFLWIVRLLLAEEMKDDALFEELRKSPPNVGAA